MITLCVSIAVLFIGYFLYGEICERIFEVNHKNETPAYSSHDGVDFVPLPKWKTFLIQLLNIAGLGPIFGAVAGAMWGPVAFLWIVLGSIFAGGVHDYFSGMLSLRNSGVSFTEISGTHLGKSVLLIFRILTFVLLIMVGTVFFVGPAHILVEMIDKEYITIGFMSGVILLYYFVSTVLPVDKIIGRLYPIFGVVFLFMTLSILGAIFYYKLPVSELTLDSFTNLHSTPEKHPVFPMLFITIACGAISGFHATQSPIIARCIKNEKEGKFVFFGTMATEGVVALIWAAVSMSFFGGISELNVFMDSNGGNAAVVVNNICNELLGPFGGAIALLGVVVAPITSGDTAFRSARLLLADVFNISQERILYRVILSITLFILAYFISKTDFEVIWRYFAWTNQTLAVFVLWTITVYLLKKKKPYFISLIPALFMTMVSVSYIFIAPEGLGMNLQVGLTAGTVVTTTLMIMFLQFKRRFTQGNKTE